jgi:hypothetical protein
MARSVASFVAIAALFAGVTDCTPPRVTATSAAATPARTPTAAPVMRAWRYTLPSEGVIASIVAAGDREIVSSGSGIAALDVSSGAVEWRRNEPATVRAASNATFFAATPSGGLEARSTRDGSAIWLKPHVCGMPQAAAIVVRNGGDLIAGCARGELVRVDAATGTVLARTLAFELYNVSAIVSLGGCAYGVSGFNEGAVLRFYSGIVGCKALDTILPLQEDASILGAVRGDAVVDDTCCMGRPDVYRPATIYTVSLTTGVRSPQVDLTPEPNRYPSSARPIGQGSMAMLAENTLYLFVDHAGYRYGDPQFIEPPLRVIDDLRAPPVSIDASTLLAETQSGDGTLGYALLRLHSGNVERLWSAPESTGEYPPTNIDSFAVAYGAPDRSAYLRIRDRRELVPSEQCPLAHADDRLVILRCPTKQLTKNGYVEYLSAYRW